MFIQTEPTPNPATLKLLPGRAVMPSGTANFTDAAAAGRSPLAERLFAVPGVTGVFLATDFVTVTKSENPCSATSASGAQPPAISEAGRRTFSPGPARCAGP